MDLSIKSNIPEFSVSELAFSLKKTLEDNYGRVRVRGELSRVKIHTSGHMYTDLKDIDSVINAVCWKGTVSKLSLRPTEGLEVICTGRITTYPARSNYQLIIESMELAGEGALLKMLEDRRKALAAEGLFDAARKKPLPFLPEIIGVVTSATGSVIRDILHRIEDRFPRHVIVWPVAVQGENAANQIAAAINGFNAITGKNRPDLIIVARGGGSLEDLMPFNEESVVRAAANSVIPLISAVGHETDTTLIDYAADVRAPTPSAAAEMAVPVRLDMLAGVMDARRRLTGGLTRMISETRHRLAAKSAGIADPRRVIEIKTQKFDHAADGLHRAFKSHLNERRVGLNAVSARLRTPGDSLARARQDFVRSSDRMNPAMVKYLKDAEGRVSHAGQMLEAYSFENVLQRGFAVVQDNTGALITDAQTLKTGQEIIIRFKDKKTVPATVGKSAQGRLF